MVTITQQSFYLDTMKEDFGSLIQKDEDFQNFVDAIWQTRKGLYSLMDKRPDLFDSLKPQFDALNNLVSILLETGKGVYHPDKFYKPNI